MILTSGNRRQGFGCSTSILTDYYWQCVILKLWILVHLGSCGSSRDLLHRLRLSAVHTRWVRVSDVLVELENKDKEKNDPTHLEEGSSSTDQATVAVTVLVTDTTVFSQVTRSSNCKSECDEVKAEDEQESNSTLHEKDTNGGETCEHKTDGSSSDTKVNGGNSPVHCSESSRQT